MKRQSYFHYCMIASLVAAMPCVVYGAVKRPNRAESYSKIAAMASAAQYVDDTYYADLPGAETTLPVRVANPVMAETLARGETYDAIGVSDLDSCARIYPDGEFEWGVPTAGIGRGGAATCVAVVELRSTDPVPGSVEKNVVLARATVAAGDSVKCNISDFPADSYTPAAGEITFPADNEPTRQDVVSVMNQEQKQNAGIKIAALTVAGALGGNVAGKNEVGQDSLLGTGKHKMQSTAIGALGGAALAVGNVYGGKVAGDMILSTGVNAVAGATIGNMAATGDEVLRIEDCTLEDGKKTTCLWGRIVQSKPIESTEAVFYDSATANTIVCKESRQADGSTVYTDCMEEFLVSVKLDACPEDTIDNIKTRECMEKVSSTADLQYHRDKDASGKQIIVHGGGEVILAKVASAGRPGTQVAAMVINVSDKTFGLKRSDWAAERKKHGDGDLRGRNTNGSGYKLDSDYKLSDFYPMYVSAEDGGVIDFSNKARLKGTLIGAGAGGALGAFTAYQGAKDDIENRWVSAVRDYKDSLQKVYCITGRRFLSYYNDTVGIPARQ